MPGIEGAERAVAVSGEDGDCRILISFFVFAAEIVLKCAGAGTQESQSVPASRPSMAPQGCRIRRSNDRQIEIWSQVVRNTIEAVDPRRAHRTWLRLFFAVHELINDDRPVRSGEKLAESYSSDRLVSFIQFHGDFLEYIILDGWTFWKPTA